MQCTNHLKQVGIGVHNFHDTLKGLPPVMLWNGTVKGNQSSDQTLMGRMSFWGTIYPFVEQQALYDKCIEGDTTTAGEGFDRYLNSDWWHGLSDAEKRGFGSVSYYRCPSRRSGGPLYADERTNISNPGPQTDYAIPAIYRDNGAGLYRLLDEVWMQQSINLHAGPFRVAEVTLFGSQIISWQPRDTFAWWQDGTSNQIIVSEKHLPLLSIGQCAFSSSSAAQPPETRLLDCSYLAASANSGSDSQMRADLAAHAFVLPPNRGGQADYWGRVIARGDVSEPATTGGRWPMDMDNPVLGSAHPGVFNVLMGDGSVQGIPKTANPDVICLLSVVNDGAVVSLPQ